MAEDKPRPEVVLSHACQRHEHEACGKAMDCICPCHQVKEAIIVPAGNNIIMTGDKIRFSTELLKQIDEQPDHQTATCIVHDIKEVDGYKMILLGWDK